MGATPAPEDRRGPALALLLVLVAVVCSVTALALAAGLSDAGQTVEATRKLALTSADATVFGSNVGVALRNAGYFLLSTFVFDSPELGLASYDLGALVGPAGEDGEGGGQGPVGQAGLDGQIGTEGPAGPEGPAGDAGSTPEFGPFASLGELVAALEPPVPGQDEAVLLLASEGAAEVVKVPLAAFGAPLTDTVVPLELVATAAGTMPWNVTFASTASPGLFAVSFPSLVFNSSDPVGNVTLEALLPEAWSPAEEKMLRVMGRVSPGDWYPGIIHLWPSGYVNVRFWSVGEVEPSVTGYVMGSDSTEASGALDVDIPASHHLVRLF